ncbi:hypothetical protein [Aquimarina longa]|uniref:hypothetical protein n=1 Tax=Aquimarina longa TaxID=1080221 RepID=UPI0007843EC5|nr:hypothetical protein [Aquimarina longa]
MDLDTFIYLSAILIPLSAFVFLRKYIDKNNLWFITGGGIVTIVGYLSIYISTIEDKKVLYINMIVPLYAALLYKGISYLFFKQFNRLPIDTFFEHEGNIWDRLFNIIYTFLITVVPLLLLLFI